MKLRITAVFVATGLAAPLLLPAAAAVDSPAAWPAPTATTRPWAYWHWMGSAVDETNLVRELQRYAAAGLGGLHIVPIYGARGFEDRYIPYLSERWMQRLGFAVTEARRLGMDIDMTTGTGWNFGGPDLPPALTCWRLETRAADLAPGAVAPLADRDTLLAALAEAPDGQVLDLTSRVRDDGSLDWTVPAAGWKLRTVRYRAGAPEVERPAPGGEGPMLNPFHRAAIDRYLERFTAAFAGHSGPKPRAMYHDSYEYHGTAWAADLLAEFAARRGYRLEAHRAALFGAATNDVARRIRCDYRETLSDLLLDAFARPWADWCRRQGFLTRNQAHGSPGNLLDLYAVATIPETEMFARDRDILVSKFASSAAHVAGRPLVGAETGTWVAEHFTETLADLKRNLDDLFLAGVNHVLYHGTCYSPDDAGWPGWLFYASTQWNPRNSIWRDAPLLNAYVTRCQSILQSGQPDPDVLVYWPIHDLWYSQDPLVNELGVHRRQWLDGQRLGVVARHLWQRGYAFDFASDRQLAGARAEAGQVVTAGARYRAVVVPRCRFMPPATVRVLLALAGQGTTVIFDEALPADVPGFGRLEERRLELRSAWVEVRLGSADTEGRRRAKLGRGTVWVGDVERCLAAADIGREALTDDGRFAFVRRASGRGHDYFLVHRTNAPFEGWLPLAVSARAVAIMDPMDGRVGLAASRPGGSGGTEVLVQTEPGQSLFLRTLAKRPSSIPAWPYVRPTGPPVTLSGEWQVEFLEGGPELPPPLTLERPGTWATAGGEAAARFAGTARYSIRFDAPGSSDVWQLDLGAVAQSARVRLNGEAVGAVFMPPNRLICGGLRPRDNRLEVEVTSTAANRIRDLDRRGVKWKNFHDINFVSIQYQPFDASGWPLHDAGLLGPVTLMPAAVVAQP